MKTGPISARGKTALRKSGVIHPKLKTPARPVTGQEQAWLLGKKTANPVVPPETLR